MITRKIRTSTPPPLFLEILGNSCTLIDSVKIEKQILYEVLENI